MSQTSVPHAFVPLPPVPPDEARPAHYRLSRETWDMILKEYREGATARFLASKWRVSEAAIRRRATQHGSTKRDWGDRQAVAQVLAREAEFEEARRNSPEAVAARLFDGVAAPVDEAEASDPAHLERMATLASGRAMTGRLWAEARALAGLAESYARLVDRQRARVREDTPPEDGTEPGRQVALAFLRSQGVLTVDTDDFPRPYSGGRK